MPAPVLRRYAQNLYVANTETTVVPAVPAARALVVSKIVVVNAAGAAVTFRLVVGGFFVAADMALGFGEVYTESGLVVLAGDLVRAQCSAANGMHVQVFGEEVDN